MSNISPEAKEELALVRKHCEQLLEHFDCVQIFVQRYASVGEEGTVAIQRGSGNYYSRYGQVMEWIIKQDEYAREQVMDEEPT